MTTGGATFNGTDIGAAPCGLILEQRRMALTPKTRDRGLLVPGRPGSYDFGSELGERTIELDGFINQSTNVALEAAVPAIASLFDPTNEASGDKGFKQLIFDTLSDRYFLAKLTGEPLVERLVTTGRVVLTMRCSDPFAYSTTQYVVQGGQATITGFNAYRQAPEKIGWNLIENGATVSSSKWTLIASMVPIVDSTSPTGYAFRQVIAVPSGPAVNYQDVLVEAGKAYSFGAYGRSDGSRLLVTFDWYDSNGVVIAGGDYVILDTMSTTWVQGTTANKVAPGNARKARFQCYGFGGSGGIYFYTGLAAMQQTTAPAAWTAAQQQLLTQKGLAIYEASTNLVADGDMEAVGVASWSAVNASAVKDTATVFAGGKSIKVTNAAANGYIFQSGALAAAQPISASVRCFGGDSGAGISLISTPSNALIGSSLVGGGAGWQAVRVSGAIAGGDTGWQVRLIGGSGTTTTSYFDNLAVENKAYDTMNADPSGQAFALAGRTVSSVTLPLPSGFDITDFARVIAVRLDHAYSGVAAHSRYVWEFYVDANNFIDVFVDTAGQINFRKFRATITAGVSDAGATAPVAGDTLVIGARYSASVGLELQVSKNGGAPVTYTLATAEAKLPLAGASTNYLGRYGGATGNELDGTVGVDRVLKGGLSAAQISAIMAAPYAAQDESIEMAVYRFDGAAAPENYGQPNLLVDVGGTYQAVPVIEVIAAGAFTGALTVTDDYGNVLTWTGTLALNDDLKVDSGTFRVYLNGAVSMAGVTVGSKWPVLRPNARNTIAIGGIAGSNIKNAIATFRSRWI